MKTPLLEVIDVHAYYGKSRILHGVTFRVEEGEIVSCSIGNVRFTSILLKNST
jgi:ABC-type branched-subunit amino acid transport system ATPase component